MTLQRLSVGFIALTDAAPFIAAEEMGFAREEGLSLELIRAPSWSSLRDMLVFGSVEAAHMLAPVPVAMALGIGGVASSISALSVTSINGTVIGVSNDLAARLADQGHRFAFSDAEEAGAALVQAAKGTLRIGVPFPFSMHAELLYYWLDASGLPSPQNVAIRTVPPSLMADALAADEIDAFCVGEPWGSIAVESGVGALLLPGRAIWSFAPEKVLAVRTPWATEDHELTGRLMRSVWRACRWLGQGGAQTTAAELLSRAPYLNLSSEVLDRGLSGRIVINSKGDTRECSGFIEFHRGAANYPWRSQAAWIASRMAGRLGLDKAAAMSAAREVFRIDLYRKHLKDAGAALPSAAEKIEGGITDETAVATEQGRLILAQNQFFDGQFFDPDLHK